MAVKVKTNLKKSFTRVIKNSEKEILELWGKEGVRLIKGFTRTGRDLTKEKGRQKPLADSTVSSRKRLARSNRTNKAFSPGRSNLTLTGQLIDALSYRLGKMRAEIFVKPSIRKNYKSGSKRGKKNSILGRKTLTNEDLAEFLAQKGRNFVGLDKESKQIIFNKTLRLVRNKLRNRKK